MESAYKYKKLRMQEERADMDLTYSQAREQKHTTWSERGQKIEILLIFFLGQYLLWNIDALPGYSIYIFLSLILISFVIHKDKPTTLGFQTQNFVSCFFHYREWILFLWILLFLDIITGNIRTILYLVSSFFYLYSVILQQIFFNCYLVHRISKWVSIEKTKWMAAFIFTAFHLPNIALTVIALPAGYLFSSLFLKYRNIWAIIAFHYVSSVMLNTDLFPILEQYIPLDNFWNMRVGNGYWKP